jgi:hypothetical protein
MGAIVEGPKETEVEKSEFYVKKLAQIAKGADASTAVGAHLGQQVFSIIDNLFTDDLEERKQEAKTARHKDREARKAAKERVESEPESD